MKAYQVKIRASIDKPNYKPITSTGLVFDKNAKEAEKQALEKLKDSFTSTDGSFAIVVVLSVKPVPSAFVLFKGK